MSDNPSIKKLSIKPDQNTAVLFTPAGFLSALGNLPNGVEVNSELDGIYDLIHAFFFTRYQELGNQIEDIRTTIVGKGILWISYQKQSAKKESDLNRDILWEN